MPDSPTIQKTDLENENAAILVGSDGLAAYGRVPSARLEELSGEEVDRLHEQVLGTRGPLSRLRQEASRILEDLDAGPLKWPLDEEEIQSIRQGRTPPGTLLVRLTDGPRSEGIETRTQAI